MTKHSPTASASVRAPEGHKFHGTSVTIDPTSVAWAARPCRTTTPSNTTNHRGCQGVIREAPGGRLGGASGALPKPAHPHNPRLLHHFPETASRPSPFIFF